MSKTKPLESAPTSTSTEIQTTASAPEPQRVDLAQLIAGSKQPAYLIAAAAQKAGWLPGQEVTREAFEQALREAAGEVIK